MVTALTITKFRTSAIPFAFIGMAVLRLPLFFNKKCKFWKLLGCGKNAQVDLLPNFKHWGLLTTWKNQSDCEYFYQNSFEIKWYRFFGIEEFTVFLKPLSAHGSWDGKQPFETENKPQITEGKIAVITRASIYFNKIKEFRQAIKKAAEAMRNSPGLIVSAGIGESPFFRQATFSIWEGTEQMKAYAYKNLDHADVIKKTRERNWYSEELFARFEIIKSWGTLNGNTIEIQDKKPN